MPLPRAPSPTQLQQQGAALSRPARCGSAGGSVSPRAPLQAAALGAKALCIPVHDMDKHCTARAAHGKLSMRVKGTEHGG